ncbi:MAG: alanine--tRNA ligase [Myxococcales bacterium]|nr:alanine--tRNA ligase [Myxococcales bacterium]
MKQLTHNELRSSFLRYFEERGHRVIASHSLIPPADPTLLFVNAGMVQFKDIFTGREQAEYGAAATVQKCMRVSGKHNDLETVGFSERHQTFFEMLGNFAFGDYFKREAIQYGWEYLTGVLELPKERLWVTIHPDDRESERIWLDEVGFPADRLQRFESNFWSMGDTGPCGPCSEIHIDTTPDAPVDHASISVEHDARFLELWNLVFMQYERHADGSQTELPRPCVDTGMGFERILSVIQGVDSNYKGDVFAPIFNSIAEVFGRQPASDAERVAFKVIADHGRATAFLIGDGVYPENEGRGYVLRRIMRRAIRFGFKLGLEEAFLYKVCGRVVDTMGEAYPNLVAQRALIEKLVLQEEQRFGRTLADGLGKLNAEIERIAARVDATHPIDGELAFQLHDTYGFPVDLTQLIAREAGLEVDLKTFAARMDEQKQRGRESWKDGRVEVPGAVRELAQEGRVTRFVGYGETAAEGAILALVHEGEAIETGAPGQRLLVITDCTPFYAESGGQVGDVGRFLDSAGRVRFVVEDTQKSDGVFMHAGVVGELPLSASDGPLQLVVDAERRRAIEKNHSATHLMHYALRTKLGTHVKQRGSLVDPERLRFDFSHFSPVTDEEIETIERLVNEKIRSNHAVVIEEMPIQKALDKGALAFFGEKYGANVRVVEISRDSIELCGGTHVRRSGEIGLFTIVSEGSIASGVRRVEAYTGNAALARIHDQQRLLRDACALVQSSPDGLIEKVQRTLERARELQHELDQLKREQALRDLDGYLSAARELAGGGRALAALFDDVDAKNLRELGDKLRDKLGSGILLLVSTSDDKVIILLMVTSELTSRFHAGKLVGQLAAIVGGRGGGRPEMAQAGGPETSKVRDLEARFYELVSQ